MPSSVAAIARDQLSIGVPREYALRPVRISAISSWPKSLLPSYCTSMRRVRRDRLLATAVGISVFGKTPIISHLLSPVCTQSAYCFPFAMALGSQEHPDATHASSVPSSQGILNHPATSFSAIPTLSLPNRSGDR